MTRREKVIFNRGRICGTADALKRIYVEQHDDPHVVALLIEEMVKAADDIAIIAEAEIEEQEAKQDGASFTTSTCHDANGKPIEEKPVAPERTPKEKIQEAALAELLQRLREYGSLDSRQREATQSPWWAIIDPDALAASLADPGDVLSAVARAISGPYFSRASAEHYLMVRGCEFSKSAVVYCLGASRAFQWTWFADHCKLIAGIDPQTGGPL